MAFLSGGAASSTAVQDKIDGNGPPGVNDDQTAGYSFRSLWIDISVSPLETWLCLDASAGAAVWEKISLTIDELGSMAVQDADAVNITGGTITGTSMDPASVVMPVVAVTAAAGTTNLDATKSNALYLLTGSTTQTFALPETPDLGTRFRVKNLSTGNLTVRGRTQVQNMSAALKDGNTNSNTHSVFTDNITANNGVALDFGVNTELIGWSVFYNYTNDGGGSIKVQYSDNNSSWTTAVTGTYWTNKTAWNALTWATVGAHRYWRLVVATEGWGGYLTEMKVTTPTGDIETGDLPDFTFAGTGFAVNGVGDLLDTAETLVMGSGDSFEFEYVASHLWAVRY